MARREPVRRTAAASSQRARGQRLCLWCLFPISEDVMSLWCGWDSYRAEGGGRAPLGGHRAVPSRRAESAGGPGSCSPAPSARRGKPGHSARLVFRADSARCGSRVLSRGTAYSTWRESSSSLRPFRETKPPWAVGLQEVPSWSWHACRAGPEPELRGPTPSKAGARVTIQLLRPNGRGWGWSQLPLLSLDQPSGRSPWPQGEEGARSGRGRQSPPKGLLSAPGHAAGHEGTCLWPFVSHLWLLLFHRMAT